MSFKAAGEGFSFPSSGTFLTKTGWDSSLLENIVEKKKNGGLTLRKDAWRDSKHQKQVVQKNPLTPDLGMGTPGAR